MKEIRLQDLLNLADASAHDGICDFWNQKAIHYLVVFTSTQEDFEIIGIGPTLHCATLDDASRHVIPGKTPEFYVQCPAAVVKRLQPKLAPAGLHQPVPSMKGRTSFPFSRPESKPAPAPSAPPTPDPADSRAQDSSSVPIPSPAAIPPPPSPAPVAPSAPPAPALPDENRELLKNYAERLAALEARERSLAEREAHLKERLAELNRREESLKIPTT